VDLALASRGKQDLPASLAIPVYFVLQRAPVPSQIPSTTICQQVDPDYSHEFTAMPDSVKAAEVAMAIALAPKTATAYKGYLKYIVKTFWRYMTVDKFGASMNMKGTSREGAARTRGS
jgi:hypothetical protein